MRGRRTERIARRRARAGSFAFASWALCALLLGGCSTSAPLLTEPRTPRKGDIRFQVGASALAPVGGDTHALADARSRLANGTTPADEKVVNEVDSGAAVALAARPGVAPVVRATVTAAPGLETSLRYGGADLGLSARFVFLESRTAGGGARTLSVGLDLKTLLLGRPDDGYSHGMAFESMHGYGGALPIIAAIQSDGGLLFGYLGWTFGFDRVTARVAYPGLGPPSAPIPGGPSGGANARLREATVNRFFGAATLGLGLGFRRVHVIAELGVERDVLSANFESSSPSVSLWCLAPAFAVSTSF